MKEVNSKGVDVGTAKASAKRIEDYLNSLQKLFLSKQISFSEYEGYLISKHDGKTLHEWLDFYRKQVKENEINKTSVMPLIVKVILGVFVLGVILLAFDFNMFYEGIFLAPSPITSVVLNATDDPLNTTDANLTLFVDPSGNSTQKNIINWYIDKRPLIPLNMPFEGNGGNESTATKDYSGNGNVGSVNGTFWNLTGGVDNFSAYEFDGIDDYINVLHHPALEPQKGITITAWVKPNNMSGIQGLVTKHDNVQGTAKGYTMYQFGSALVCAWGNSGDLWDNSFTSATAFSFNKWTFVSCSFEETKFYKNNTMKVYVNGELRAIRNTSYDLLYDVPEKDIDIGKRMANFGTVNQDFFNGTIDEIKIFNRALSKNQIKLLYQNQTGLITSDSTFYGDVWKTEITPNDRFLDGSSVNSTELEIENILVKLNATDDPVNTTEANLTVFTDTDNDNSIKRIYNWYINDNPLNALNMPFEAGLKKDYSGNGNNGFCDTNGHCPKYVQNGGGDGFGAFKFENSGSSDYIEISDNGSLDIPVNWTIGAWVKPDSTATSQAIIIKGDAGSTNDGLLNYGLFLLDTGNYQVKYGDGSSNSGTLGSLPAVLGQWQHLVGRLNDTALSIFLDGNLVNSVTKTTGDAYNSNAFYLGIREINSYSTPFNGTLDEIKIWNRSLSEKQIKAIYQNRTDLIVSQETDIGEGWKVEITPINRLKSGKGVNSSIIFIQDAPHTPPEITNASSIGTVNPTEGTFTPVSFSFSIVDFDSVYDINDSKVIVNFTRDGEPVRENSVCSRVENLDFFTANFSCSINMWYFDQGGQWNVTIWAEDNEGKASVNESRKFTYSLLTALVLSPNSLSWNVTIGDFNQSANNHPTIVNNTGNVNRSLNIVGLDLYGETNPGFKIPVENISVSITDGLECGGTQLFNGSAVEIQNSFLPRGNLSLGSGTAQEEIYYCMRFVPFNIPSQPYSTSGAGGWIVSLVVSVAVFSNSNRKRRKKKFGKGFYQDNLVKALKLLILNKRINFPLKENSLENFLSKEISKKYCLSRVEVFEQVLSKNIVNLPSDIFNNKLGILESIVKYMKENLKLSYREISRSLNRDERTIWNAYKKSKEKHRKNFELTNKENRFSFPLEIFKIKELTPFEIIAVYLKSKKLSDVEIGEILSRNKRNIWKTYSNAKNKLKNIKV